MNDNDESPRTERGPDAFQADFEVPKRYKSGGSSTLELGTNLARSRIAISSLLLAQLITGLGCIVILCAGLYVLGWGLLTGDVARILYALIVTPIAFVLEFASFVVFARVAEL